MMKRIQRRLILMIIIVMVLPMLVLGNGTVASAKTKWENNYKHNLTISNSKKTLYPGENFTLSLNNTDSVKKIIWSTQNKKVAVVQASNDAKQAVVTAVSGGTTLIKCKVTYNDGKTATKSCKVTVKVTAKSIVISNTKEVNGKHIIEVGDSYKFKSKLYPRNAKDNVYWFINNTEYATVNSKGVVTAKKTGLVLLTAVAAKDQASAYTSTVRDTVYLEIINASNHDDNDDDDDDYDDDDDDDDYDDDDYYYSTPYVKSVELTESSKLSITFDKAISSSTVIGTNSSLLNSVIITPKYDGNGILGNVLGTLTASLSSDGKILTIQSSNYFNGLYSINLTSAIKSTYGIALNAYSKDITLKDTKAPTFVKSTIDTTGSIVTLNFSEVMNFSNMMIAEVKAATAGQTIETATLFILSSNSSYIISADRRSLIINLSGIPAVDQNKKFSVRLFGVKDLTGNYLNGDTIIFGSTSYVKSQARVTSLERTGYYTLTATFDSAIKTPGYVVVNNNEWIQGVVDTKNSYKVNYTLSAAAAQLVGWQKVLIGYWDGYNVLPEDNTADTLIERNVLFTIGTSQPLPAPASITQSAVDPSIIQIQFNYLLDEATAENLANFYIPGAVISSAELTNNSNSATVKLTIKQGSLISQIYSITISGIKGLNNSYTVMNPFSTTISLKENTPPVLQAYGYTYPATIVLTFNEKISGTPSFTVMQNGSVIGCNSVIKDNTVIITLHATPVMNQSLQITPNTINVLTDLAGNKIANLVIPYVFPMN